MFLQVFGARWQEVGTDEALGLTWFGIDDDCASACGFALFVECLVDVLLLRWWNDTFSF